MSTMTWSFLGHSGLDDVQKADELLMAMAFHALANDLALKDIERREQGGDTMALVIMGYGASAPLVHRQTRLSAIKRLNLALLVDRQDNGVVGRRRGRRSRAVWRQTADRRLRHRRTGPVTGRLGRAGQRQGDHTFSRLRAQRRNTRPPGLVPPKAGSSFAAETFLPAPDHRLGLAGGLHDLGSAATVGRQKDDLCPPNVLLRLATTASSLLTVRSAQLDVRSLVHPPAHAGPSKNPQSESKC